MKLASDGVVADLRPLSYGKNNIEKFVIGGYKLNPQSEEVWNKVRNIMISNSYQRDRVEQALKEDSFNIDYHYIETDATSPNDVIGFSVWI